MEDKDITNMHLSLRRPPHGYGRTSSELDKEGHTARITNDAAYAHNLKLLAQAESRKKRKKVIGEISGISNVRFTIAHRSEFVDGNIHYYHVRVRQQMDSPFHPDRLHVAVPKSLCGKTIALGAWPTMALLENRTRTLLRKCGSVAPPILRWFGVDLRTALGKLVKSEKDLGIFVRSLAQEGTGVLVLDAGQRNDDAYIWRAPSIYSICQSRIKRGKHHANHPISETIMRGRDRCKKNHSWTLVAHFEGFSKEQEGKTQLLCVGNQQSACARGTTLYVDSKCRGERWQGVKWGEQRIIVGTGSDFCVSEAAQNGNSYTRISTKCTGNKVMTFSSAPHTIPKFPKIDAKKETVFESFILIDEDRSCAPDWICPENSDIAMERRK